VSGRVTITDVVDTRVRDPEPGQQAQTVAAAEKARPSIDGCTCVVLLAFIPDPAADGGFTVEVGVGGSGPAGFGAVVERSMRGVAGVLGRVMTTQEDQRS
jgi:hypothetical protein